MLLNDSLFYINYGTGQPKRNTPLNVMNTRSKNSAGILRSELLRRAEAYVTHHGLDAHVYRSRGKPPTVLFRSFQSEGEERHGNFHDESYAEIVRRPDWASRLQKPHSCKGNSCFLECDAATACELDSCTSSDALAMNIFCHPSSPTNTALARLFGFDHLPNPDFGFKANLPFLSGQKEPRSTEIDVQFYSPAQTVLAECKLTETHFTFFTKAKVERYSGFAETFDVDRLLKDDCKFPYYQLIRNVLAARYHKARFCLICDQRRPDLQAAYDEVVSIIRDQNLRLRCSVVTWQQIADTLPTELQTFLTEKYGIGNHGTCG